jgi:DNA-binding MarR family transcriptional regulator
MAVPTEFPPARIRWLFAQKELACARYARAAARTVGRSEHELRLLVTIARHDRISPSLLHLRAGISAAPAGAAIGELERAGLVTRCSQQGDHRRATLELTPEAEAMLQIGFAELATRIDAVFAALSPKQQQTVGAFLADVADASARAAEEAEATAGSLDDGSVAGVATGTNRRR